MYIKKFVLLAIVLTFGIGVTMAKDETGAEDNVNGVYMRYVQWGDEAVAKQKWEEAISYYREAMTLEPSSPQNVMLLSNIGMIQHYEGNDSLALHTLSEARAMAPASVVILRNRANILLSMGRTDDALNDYNRVIEMDSTYAEAYYDRASILLRRGALDKAEADALKYVNLRPDDLSGKLIMAVIYTNTARPEDALPLYNDLIKAQPDAVYYSARAMCRMAMDDLQEASNDIALGLELDPNDGELYYCRASLNILRYREEDARADAAKAVELGVDKNRAEALFRKSKK